MMSHYTTQGFSMPLMAQPYGPPPYPVEDAALVVVRYEVQRAILQDVVPAPLQLNSDPVIITAFAGTVWQSGGPGLYAEGGIVIPVQYAGKVSSYAPIVLTSTAEALIVGREVFGLPKLMCEPAELRSIGNTRVCTLSRNGNQILSVAVSVDRPADGREVLPHNRYMVKVIPSFDETKVPSRQLIYQELDSHVVHGSWCGKGWLQLGNCVDLRMDHFLPHRLLDGWYVKAKWNVPPAKFVRTL